MSLYTKIIDIQKLQAAWDKVRRNKPASGVDCVNYDSFENNRKQEIKQLNLELLNHEYRVQPVKLVRMQRDDKFREISLYTMRDKTVQTSLAMNLGPSYEKTFSSCTYAYRSDRSALIAVNALEQEIMKEKYSWCAKLDISSFFDHIQLYRLLDMLRKRIKEDDVLDLIMMQLNAPSIGEGGELVEKKVGLYQGSSISPLLSNVYMDEFDHEMENEDIFFVRYSDDMVLLGHDQEKIQLMVGKIRVLLENLGLSFNDKKSYVRPMDQGFDFLGYSFDQHGKAIPAKASEKLEISLEDIWLTQSNLTLSERLVKGSQILNGWEQYFRGERQIKSIYEYVVLVYMTRYKPEIKEFAERRKQYVNSYKDITRYLAEVWKEQDRPDLVLLEYEQYYKIPASGFTGNRESYMEELLGLYDSQLILEQTDNWTSIMQDYSDLGYYNQAEKIMEYIQDSQNDSRSQTVSFDTEMEEKTFEYDVHTLNLIMDLFVGREDMYAREVLTADGRRRSEFVPEPLTREVIKSHLAGTDTVGTFLVRNNDTVHYLVIDIDISKKTLLSLNQKEIPEIYLKKAAQTTEEIMSVIRKMGLKTYAEFSGYRGYHIWLFFTEWIPVRYAYSLLDIVQKEIGDVSDDISVEAFPLQGKKRTGSSGQSIKLPYGIHLLSGKRSFLCKDDMTPAGRLNDMLSSIAKYSLADVKRVVAARISPPTIANKAQVPDVQLDMERLGDISDNVRQVLYHCTLMKYLVNKSMTTGYLPHAERLSILYVFGHLGDDGKNFVHTVMSFTLNYQYHVTQRFIDKLPEKPVSCIKLREQYKAVTAEYGCNCIFRQTKNCYPSPVLHALKNSSDDGDVVTLPMSRTLPKEKREDVYQELNIHVKIQGLAKKIVELKKQKRGIDKSIDKVEKELMSIYDNANVDCMEVDMGMLVRRKKGQGYEWLIEI